MNQKRSDIGVKALEGYEHMAESFGQINKEKDVPC